MGYYPKKKPKSVYRGVKYSGLELGKKQWIAIFTHNNNTINSQKFNSELLAAKWYDRTALKHLGDRAILNFPEKLALNLTLTTSKRSRETDEQNITTSSTTATTTATTPKTSPIKHLFFEDDGVTISPAKQSKQEKSEQEKPKQEKKYQTGTKRKKFTQQTKNKICSSQHWNCNFCKKRLKDVYHIDHMVPLYIGGSNETWNLQALCPSCDTFKTSFIDNNILFPLAKERTVTPQDVINAQIENYHKMECVHPDTPHPNHQPPASPSKSDAQVNNTINITPSLVNIGDLSKLLTNLGSTHGVTISINPLFEK